MPGCHGSLVMEHRGAVVMGCWGARVVECPGYLVMEYHGALVMGCLGALVTGCWDAGVPW